MIRATLQTDGQDYTIVIPATEVARLGLSDGQEVTVLIQPADQDGALAPEVIDALNASWKRNEAGYRYLAE